MPARLIIPQIIASLLTMTGKKILLGVSGSIAAYKIPLLVRLCIKAGAEVKVIMTPSAAQFVSPLVLSTLSKNEVLIDISAEDQWANHVMLGRWADIMLLAPASCNTLAKMTHGICDNLLLAVYLSATCPVMIAPAMDEDMWHHPATQQNLSTLSSFGHHIIPAEHGELASGLVGMGRMAEPETLCTQLQQYFLQAASLQGLKALVTAGPTYENIDPVRFIGNYSTGKMGIALAESLAERGCEVELVLGPTQLECKHPRVHTTRVRSAEQMFEATTKLFPDCRLAILSAAVADYTPQLVSKEKIKKKDNDLSLTLVKTKDILKELGKVKTEKQVLVGFALETQQAASYALQKLNDKNADMIVMNSLQDVGAGFGFDTNQVTLFVKHGEAVSLPLQSKKSIADQIVQHISPLLV